MEPTGSGRRVCPAGWGSQVQEEGFTGAGALQAGASRIDLSGTKEEAEEKSSLCLVGCLISIPAQPG